MDEPLKKHDDLIALARDRMDDAATADKPNREMGLDDLRKTTGEIWGEEERRAREEAGRPVITINPLNQYVRQVTGQIRQLNPAIKVSPADGAANDEVAEVYEGLIRAIQYNSDAASVFEAAAESAAACGIGHFRVRAKYCDGATFDQEIMVERIHNPFSVFWDPQAKMPTREDADYCFVVEEMGTKAFADAYPKASVEAITAEHKDNTVYAWGGIDTVTVAEYFWIERQEVEIGLLRDGSVVESPRPPMDILRTRKMIKPVVKWAKITGAEVLEGPKELPGQFIPVFAVTGEEWHVGESMYRSSVIRFAKDPVRLYCYERSTDAEITAAQPKAPYLITTKQVQGHETHWQRANQSNFPFLPYNPDPNAPPPMRVPPPVSSQGLMNQMQMSLNDMSRTTGIYPSSLGAPSNETSGVAIAQRKMESQMSTSVYADNLMKAIRHCGRVMVDMIPLIYDTQRVIKILGENDAEKAVVINRVVMTAEGEAVENDMTVGRYATRVSVGPSYDTKRQESSQSMLDFIRSVPTAASVTADLVAKAQDWPDADQFAARLRHILPPGVVPLDDLPPDEQQRAMAARQSAQQAAQMMQQIEAAKAQAEIRKLTADATESEADAKKATAEAVQTQFETMIATGQMQAVIQQIVAQQLQAILSPRPAMMVPQNLGGGLPL